MKAVAVVEQGAPARLVELPKPEPGPGQLLVRMQAAGLNPFDGKKASGRYGDLALPFVAGTDGAGIVEAVGPGVTKFSVGERVFGRLGDAAHGTYRGVLGRRRRRRGRAHTRRGRHGGRGGHPRGGSRGARPSSRPVSLARRHPAHRGGDRWRRQLSRPVGGEGGARRHRHGAAGAGRAHAATGRPAHRRPHVDDAGVAATGGPGYRPPAGRRRSGRRSRVGRRSGRCHRAGRHSRLDRGRGR